MKKSWILLTVVAVFLSLAVQQPSSASSQTGTTIKELVGVNGVVNNTPSDIAQVAGWVRDYHKWYWYEAAKDVYTWSTGWQQLDSFYGALKAAGVKVMPGVELAPGWASSNGQTDGVPNAAEHAQYLGELVRHYGDTIAAVENYNEPNQWWMPVRFPASQFGTMMAGDYEAVKTANPTMPLVMAGMAGVDTAYMDAANQSSGGKFDVVNFHWYAQGDTSAGGKNPEAGGLLGSIDNAKAWRDAKAPGKPIWITEFGWDTFAQPDGRKSNIYAPEANAANYLLRALVLMQARGVDKGFVYLYRDVSDNLAYLHNVYLSTGLVTNSVEKDTRKKTGWYYLATLKSVLGDYIFDRAVAEGPNVYRYEYLLPGTNQRAAVLWARNGIRDNGYKVAHTGPAGTLVEPVEGSTTGKSSPTDGRITLSERPVFILYNSTETAPATPSVPTGTAVPATSVPTATSAPTSIPSTVVPSPTPTTGTATSQQRLVSGGFESGLQGWYLPAWFAGVVGVSGTQTHSGSQALRFEGRSTGPFVHQDVSASPGQTVQFSGWVNVPQNGSGMRMTVELVARHQYNGDLKTFPLLSVTSATNGWIQISGSAVMPDRTAVARLKISYPVLLGTAYLDDLSLLSSGAIPPPLPTATAVPTAPPATRTATSSVPPATAMPTSSVPPPTATPTSSIPPATATPAPTSGPPPVFVPGSGKLANSAAPTYAQNERRNARSPYVGPQKLPVLKWRFDRYNDHWGTDHRGTGIGLNNTVYLAAGMAGVYGIDSATGAMKWLFSPDNSGHETWVEFPPTVAADGTLYVTSENDYIYALDANGKALWNFRSDHLHTPVSISPDGSTVHFTSENGYIYALNRSDGTLKWRFQMGSSRAYGTGRRIPVVYDASGNLYFTWISTAWSLTPDGQKRWAVNMPSRGPYAIGPALADDGTLYFVFSDTLYSVTMDGRLKWGYLLSSTAFDRTPAVGPDGTVYIGGDDGVLHAVNPNGTLKWKQQYVTITGWAGGIKSNILLDASGTLYFIGRDGDVYAVNSQSHALVWRYRSGYANEFYPGIQLSLDSNGTLYAPVGRLMTIALAPSGSGGWTGVTPVPTSPLPPATAVPTTPPAPTATPVPTTPPAPAPPGSVLYGAWVGSTVNVSGNENAFEQAVGKPRNIRHWYWSVAPLSGNAANFASWSSSMPAGATLMLSWAPSPTDSTLDKVNAGTHDSYITQWAAALKSYGREVLLRPMWEDNGSWFWWYSGADWDTGKKAKFKAAFQRVVNLFRQQGATNVKFVWSPNVSGAGAATASLGYPGAAYVDWVALDGYPLSGGRGDFYSTFKPDYDALSSLGKPMMVAETGINIYMDSDRAKYLANLLEYELPTRFPKFTSFVWFNEPPYGDLLDSKYLLSLAAFKKGIGSSYFVGR